MDADIDYLRRIIPIDAHFWWSSPMTRFTDSMRSEFMIEVVELHIEEDEHKYVLSLKYPNGDTWENFVDYSMAGEKAARELAYRAALRRFAYLSAGNGEPEDIDEFDHLLRCSARARRDNA